MLNRAMRVAKRLYDKLLFGLRGYGRPVPKATWESQYQQGCWDYLDSLDELAHYMVTVGYIYYAHQSPTILDVGCGHGRLLRLLNTFGFESYLGIDLSSGAIRKAQSLAISKAQFEVADFEEWETTERFDIIVFNESLSYAKRPVHVLLRYSRWLDENGSMVVSLYRHGNSPIVWKKVEKNFTVINSTTVENQKGQMWDIGVIRPKAV